MLDEARRQPTEFSLMGADLFRAMKAGGRVGFEHVDWFNGGLFDDDAAIPLDGDDLSLMQRAANLNWSEIDTSIFGTLFERGLDPDKRSQLGAHYTDRDKIQLIVEPVITRPWLAEWAQIKTSLIAHSDNPTPPRRGAHTQPNLAAAAYRSFIARLRAFRVLDPACGSGNFLYVALLALKDIEHQVMIEAEALGLQRDFPHIGPEAVLGIEVNPYAAELARVTVWIGEIQWMRRNGFDVSRNPILKPLDMIECRDAILNPDGTEAIWPSADVVIGNPPFLGDKFMRDRLGSDYTDSLRATYAGRVPGGADLVCYWFEKVREQITVGAVRRAGLVATNSIRGGASRVVLDRINRDVAIVDAWADEEWTVDGAAVRVSLICVGERAETAWLNGNRVSEINADLTDGTMDLTKARRLSQNKSSSFQGPVLVGNFDISGELARDWLQAPLNPNGLSNAQVLRPLRNGRDLTARPRDRWVIDFNKMSEFESALFERPFQYIEQSVKPIRIQNRRSVRALYWWRYGETGVLNVAGYCASKALHWMLSGI